MNHSSRWDRIKAASEKQNAIESRDLAKRYLRIFGDRTAHKAFMHDAVRSWRAFRFYQARAQQ